MALLPDQEELLVTLVEAARRVPRFEQQFMLLSFETDQQIGTIDSIMGAGLSGQVRVLGDDVWALKNHGLVQGSFNLDGSGRFTVTAEGFAHYEQLRQRGTEATAAVEAEIRRHLDGERFTRRYPEAYERLSAAEAMLWQAKPEDDFTTIGHKLREAVQQFATTLVEAHRPAAREEDPAKTKNRLRAVLEMHRHELGDRRAALLDALVEYQDAVNGVIQRLEHGDQKPNDPLTWEDARAAVFQTLSFMFEFDRALDTP